MPLVSILIPAYNAEPWIAETIASALAQTWPRKEIVVVDDGSKDDTLSIARTFESPSVTVLVRENHGAAATRNFAYSTCQGEYIQWLDADDLLSPDKITLQLEAAEDCNDSKILLSASWAYFQYRPRKARFIPTPLWHDLSPLEWMTRKMEHNLHMQTGTWLVSRELTELAGPWNSDLLGDDDGEVLRAGSDGEQRRQVRPKCEALLPSLAIESFELHRKITRENGGAAAIDAFEY